MNPEQILEALRAAGFDLGEATSIAELSDEALAAAEQLMLEAYDEARGRVDVAACEQIVSVTEALRAEAATRITAAEADEAALVALDAIARPAAEADPAEVDPPAEVVAVDDPAVVDPAVVPVAEPVPVAVAASVTPPARRMPRAPAARRTTPVSTGLELVATITAAGQIARDTGGARVERIRDLAVPTANRLENMIKMGSDGHLPIVHMDMAFPSERTLDMDAGGNREKLDAVTASVNGMDFDAIVAAGGRCAPLPTRYEMDGISDERRPIRDALPRFNADRGGVQGIRPPVLSDLAGAVDIITETEDTNGTTKPCLTVSCGTAFDNETNAVTKCLQIGNWHKRTFIENFNLYWQLAGAQHAREAETQLWTDMIALSVTKNTGQTLGTYRDLLAALVRARAIIVSMDRTTKDLQFTVILPEWIVETAFIDLLRQIPGDGPFSYEFDEARLRSDLARRNMSLVLTPDTGQEFTTLGADGDELPGWPSTVTALVFPTGTFAFLDGGTLDFGMEIRDSTLNAANNVRSMSETWEGVSRFGIRSIELQMDLCPSGETSATTDITPLVCSSGS